MISIAHSNDWSLRDSFKSMPYMRDLLLYSGQQDNYQGGCEAIEKYLRIEADDSQMNRLCVHYGGLLEEQTKSLEEGIINRTSQLSDDLEVEEVVYAMCDGCMLPTRPHKVG